MTIEQLIKLLKKYNKDADVCFDTEGCRNQVMEAHAVELVEDDSFEGYFVMLSTNDKVDYRLIR